MAENKSGLAGALVAFQADLPEIGLDAENPHFKSKFASLPNITKIVLPKLAEQGLSFTAGGAIVEGQFGLSAALLHTSGEERSGFFPIIATDPQKIGSAITYARRYMLASLTGIVADADDDGNAASIPTVAERQLDKARNTGTSNRPAPSKDSPKEKIRVEWIEKGKVTKEKVNARMQHFKGEGLTGDAIWAAILAELEEG
jgi:hypothetical protein